MQPRRGLGEGPPSPGHPGDRNGEPSEDPWPCLFLVIAILAILAILGMTVAAMVLAGPEVSYL